MLDMTPLITFSWLPIRLIMPRLILILIAAVMLGSCSSEPASEEMVRKFIKKGEEAVENAALNTVREMIAVDYTDEAGRTRNDLVQYVRYQILRNRSIYLYISIADISFPNPDTAEIAFFAGMTGVKAEAKEIRLQSIKADLYAFHCRLTLVENTWKLASASWHPATLSDIFPE